MANHLFIGLGGTGGKVLRELRKRVYEEFRSNDPGNGIFLDYVYVDSSPADLEDRTGWKVLGKSVHLGQAQKVNINGISASVLSNINMYPGLKGFLNPNDLQLMQQEMGALITAGIGGQRRRLGRTLMANNICDNNNPSNFESIVRGAVGRLQNVSSDQDVTFHICAGLAGGTGSGSIIDAISQIRTWFPYQEDTHAFKIRLFIYTPERTLVSARHDAGFYQANGYAALLELNALSIRKYHPTDVKGERDIFTGDVRRLLDNQEAFESAYIYTNVNEQGKVLDLGEGLPAAVADFIFQTTVASGMSGTAGQLNRLVGCENNGAGPERDQAGNNAHSRKFLSFGISRIEFPETEIREFMTYTYALQAARQLTFNMWQEGIGYGERTLDEVGMGFADEIKDKKNREGLMLSNNYLTLAKPIIEGAATKKWRPFEETWERRTQADADDVQNTIDKKSWLGEFGKRCDEFFNSQFRQHGVVEFFRIQRQELRGYARTIRRHIEKKLFDEWASGASDTK
ncbi:MAG: tubulin-like doman-containing protein, partial [Bacteroidaceae bacterium]